MLRAKLSTIRKNPDIYPPLQKTVKINNQDTIVELDCGAQSSILSQELVDRLNLQTFQIDGSYQVEGIDKNSTTVPVSKATVVPFKLYNQPVEVTCFVSDHVNLKDHILLGLNFIFENMNLALRWVSESKPQIKTQEILDRCRSVNPFIPTRQIVPDGFTFKPGDVKVQKFKAWPVSIRRMNKLLRKGMPKMKCLYY